MKLAGWLLAVGVGAAGLNTLVPQKREAVRETAREIIREVLIPPEALSPEPMGGEALQPCPVEAVPKPLRESPVSPSRATGVVQPGELNIRSTPGGQVIGQLFRGDQVEILERKINGGGMEWLRTEGGWVAARFVQVNRPRVGPFN